jgi:tRNA A22 N-methylase
MKNFTLDGRLASVGEFVRQGARFADVGTDHAYLPISLLQKGRISFAVCSDINRGPLASAVENARECGVDSKCEFLLADGLSGIEAFCVTDIAICGMGGELIASILDAAPFVRDRDILLILQPMTKQAHLRRYLCNAGFEIVGERYSASQGRFYQTLAARFCGIPHSKTNVEYELGDTGALDLTDAATVGYLLQKLHSETVAMEGKRRGGLDFSYEAELVEYIKKILEGGKVL